MKIGVKTRALVKQAAMGFLGIISFLCFLVICSETSPLEEKSEWYFIFSKFIAFVTISLCFWGIWRLDKECHT